MNKKVLAIIGIAAILVIGVTSCSLGPTVAPADLNAVKAQVAALSQQIGALPPIPTADVNTLKQQVADLTNKINGLQNLANKNDIAGLQNSISGVSNDLATLKKSVDAVTAAQQKDAAAIAQLQVTPTPTPTASPTGATPGQVTATVQGNPFTGSANLAFPASANATVSQTFSFTINNGLNKQISQIQLAVGLQLFDQTGNILVNGLPGGVNVTGGTTVSISSTGVLWSYQSTGVNYLLGFTNASLGGIFGSIGSLSQGPGSQSYQATVVVTFPASVAGFPSQIGVSPVVKVVSYQ